MHVASNGEAVDRPSLRVLQISNAERGGGAERVALSLHEGLAARGMESRLLVGTASQRGTGVQQLDDVAPAHDTPVMRRVFARARRWVDRRRGRETMRYPSTGRILDALGWKPNVLHCHNLHGMAFDLTSLASFSRELPILLTLHDEWLYTGHCAYSIECERWRTGCGRCPDLDRYPGIRRDATAANLRAKAVIHRRSAMFISAPSEWLLDRARESVIAAGAVDFRLIRNGVDRDVFNERERDAARDRLGLPPSARVLLFAANQGRSSPYKDHQTVEQAALQVADMLRDEEVILLMLGEPGPADRRGNYELRPLAYEADPRRVADHYRAADVYLHGAHIDNAPLAVIEALSCGTPVVASAVGGVPEYVKSAHVPGAWEGKAHTDSANGVLVERGDALAMARAAASILGSAGLQAELAQNASESAASGLSLEHQIDETISWYRAALARWQHQLGGSTKAR
jgi:glycosyltransferase involved in cell wall biosynthesis